jgi:WD40 repeat protein
MNSLSFNSNILQVISGHLGWVRSIAFDPGNEWFCTGSADRTIKVKFTLCTPETRK